VHFGVPMLASGVSVGQGFLLEFVMTFFLVTAVWGTAVDPRAPKVGGFAIGLAVLMGILMAGPITGAAINPARAFGAALVAGAWDNAWVWWVGPLAGGAIGALAYSRFCMPDESGGRASKAA
jgi:aquaporin Z